ncbi:MAG: hypothetical protein PHV06_05290 [bacterium]|nr:hypothetical protein [bacterium]
MKGKILIILSFFCFIFNLSFADQQFVYLDSGTNSIEFTVRNLGNHKIPKLYGKFDNISEFPSGITAPSFWEINSEIDVFNTVTYSIQIEIAPSVPDQDFDAVLSYYELDSENSVINVRSDIITFVYGQPFPEITGIVINPISFSPNGDICNDTTSISYEIQGTFPITDACVEIYNSEDILIYSNSKTYSDFNISDSFTWDGSGNSVEGRYYAVIHSTDINGHSVSKISSDFSLYLNDYNYKVDYEEFVSNNKDFPIQYPFSVYSKRLAGIGPLAQLYDFMNLYFCARRTSAETMKLFMHPVIHYNISFTGLPSFEDSLNQPKIQEPNADVKGPIFSKITYSPDYSSYNFKLLLSVINTDTHITNKILKSYILNESGSVSSYLISNNLINKFEYDWYSDGINLVYIELNPGIKLIKSDYTGGSKTELLSGDWLIKNPEIGENGDFIVFSGLENPVSGQTYNTAPYKIYGLKNAGQPVLLFDPGENAACLRPSVSPDNKAVAFFSDLDSPGSYNIYIIRTEAEDFSEHILNNRPASDITLYKITNIPSYAGLNPSLISWSPDSRKLFFEMVYYYTTYESIQLFSVDTEVLGSIPYKVFSYNNSLNYVLGNEYRFYPNFTDGFENISFVSSKSSTEINLQLWYLKQENSCGTELENDVPGTVIDDSVMVKISSEALPVQEDNLFITQIPGSDSSITDPANQIPPVLSNIYDISLNSTVSEFITPIEITFFYNDDDIIGIEETDINIYVYNPELEQWELAQADNSMVIRDLDRNYITILTDHLSYFVLSGKVSEDSIGPELRLVSYNPKYISPNSDNIQDVLDISAELDQSGKILIGVYDTDGNKIYSDFRSCTEDSIVSFTWPGIDFNQNIVSDGVYSIEVVGENGAGLKSSVIIVKVVVDNTQPDILIYNVEDGKLYNNQVFPIINVNDINLKDYSITLNGAEYISGTPISKEGAYALIVTASDLAGNASVKQVNFTVDVSPPVTSLEFSGLSYFNSGITYLNSETDFILNAEDGGSGVKKTEYYLNSLPFIEYSGPVNITGDDGMYKLFFRSIDNSGNTEIQKQAKIYLDNTAPVSNLIIGEPKYKDLFFTFISSETDLEIYSKDTGSGVSRRFYSISGSEYFEVSDTFTIPDNYEGAVNISYYSADFLDNSEVPKIKSLIIDNTPPSTEYSISPSFLLSGTTTAYPESVIELNSSDAGIIPSGVSYTQYKIENSSGFSTGWINYTEPFDLKNIPYGMYVVKIKSFDNVGNEETGNEIEINIKPVLETETGIFNQESVLIWFNYNNALLTQDQKQNLMDIISLINPPYYTITESEEEFISLMRTGAFNIYLILGDFQPLSGHHSEELKEHIYSGNGIICSQYRHFIGEGNISKVQGIEFLDVFETKDLIISFDSSPVSVPGLFNSSGHSDKVQILLGSNADGYGLIKEGDDEGPAIVINEYGNGKSIFFPFDLVKSSSDPNTQTIQEILSRSIDYTAPSGLTVNPESIISIFIRIKTEPFSLLMNVEEELPDQVKLIYASPGFIQNSNYLNWEFELNPGLWKNLFITVKLPNSPGTFEFFTNYYVKVNKLFNLIGTDTVEVSITLSAEELMLEIIEEINNLSVVNEEQNFLNNSVRFIEKIELESSEKKEQNILNCLKAVENLNKIQSADTGFIRLKLDMLLKILETQ